MDDEKDTYRLWCIPKMIMQVGILVRVASSDAWNDYYIRIIREHFLLSVYFLAIESDRRMRLLTRVYSMSQRKTVPFMLAYMYVYIMCRTHTVCVQIFAGRIFRECATPNNFPNFNFANAAPQLQTCTVCVQIFMFSFSRTPVDS